MKLMMALCCSGLLTTATVLAADTTLTDDLATVKEVAARGEGHASAVEALSRLKQASADQLIAILEAMNDATPLTRNWLRGAFEAAADRALTSGTLSADALEAFVLDRSQAARVRRLAFEWLLRVDEAADDRLIPQMIDDPSGEMRRDAVAHYIALAENAESKEGEKELWQTALSGAVDDDQVKTIAKGLKGCGVTVDIKEHFGFLTEWHIIGPFDNREMKGFDVAYPPESEVSLDAEYEGQLGTVTWEPIQTDDEYGIVDIAKLTEPHKGAIDYLVTDFVSETAQPVEFRLGTANAWKLWLNGELLFAREEYHRGMRLDQYTVEGTLRPGKNQILLKVCQNEQEQDWAQKWSVQFRVCDASGRAIHSAE